MNKIIGLVTSILIIASCEKLEIPLNPVASVNVANVIVGGTTAKMNNYAVTISNNGFTQFSFLPGDNNIYIFPSSDSLKPFYNKNLTIQEGEIYSLFLGGTTSNVDVILVKDDIPYISDSAFGVRFINLSPNSSGISINVLGKPNGSEVPNLLYKQITEFKMYAGLSSNTSYAFQVRDASTGNLLTTYTFSNPSNPLPRFANVTLIVRGMTGGIPAIGVTKVNNDR